MGDHDGRGHRLAVLPVTLANLAGGKLVGDPPSSHQCKIGWNANDAGSNNGSMIYHDVVSMTNDLDAWPTVLPAAYREIGLNNAPPTYNSDGKAWPNLLNGDYVLYWKGTGNCKLVSAGTAVVEHSDREVRPGTPGARTAAPTPWGPTPPGTGRRSASRSSARR